MYFVMCELYLWWHVFLYSNLCPRQTMSVDFTSWSLKFRGWLCQLGRQEMWGPPGRYAGVGRCLWRKVSLVPCTPRNTTSVSNCQASADFCLCVHPTPKLLLSPTSLGSRETSPGNPGEGKSEKAVSSSESVSLKMLQVWGKMLHI